MLRPVHTLHHALGDFTPGVVAEHPCSSGLSNKEAVTTPDLGARETIARLLCHLISSRGKGLPVP